jgi:hypothetical protein
MNIGMRIVSCLGIILLLGLSGCAHYRAKPLRRLTVRNFAHTEHVVSFEHHVFDKYDCRCYLDRNVKGRGYQVIHITLTNNTHNTLSFSPSRFSFPCIDPQEVADTVHTNTTARAVGYGLTGIFVWPFLVPALVDGIGSSKANEKLNIDFHRKALHEQFVKPLSTINGLIFVPNESFDPDFSFVVTDVTNNKQYVLSSSEPQVSIYAKK